jgi:hypothetical protein
MRAVNNRIRKTFEDPKTSPEQKKKLCNELREKFPDESLPSWCNSPDAYYGTTVDTTLHELAGGRKMRGRLNTARRIRRLRKQRKTRRQIKTDL